MEKDIEKDKDKDKVKNENDIMIDKLADQFN